MILYLLIWSSGIAGGIACIRFWREWQKPTPDRWSNFDRDERVFNGM